MQTTLLAAGLASLLAGVIGGGLNAFGVQIPVVGSKFRQALLIALGLLLIALAVSLPAIVPAQPERAPQGDQPSQRVPDNAAAPSEPPAPPPTSQWKLPYIFVGSSSEDVLKQVHGAKRVSPAGSPIIAYSVPLVLDDEQPFSIDVLHTIGTQQTVVLTHWEYEHVENTDHQLDDTETQCDAKGPIAALRQEFAFNFGPTTGPVDRFVQKVMDDDDWAGLRFKGHYQSATYNFEHNGIPISLSIREGHASTVLFCGAVAHFSRPILREVTPE
jgi:hypothetical protein